MIFYFSMFYWHVFSIIYIGRFQLTIFACIWFFATDRENLREPLENAFEWIGRYHFGSIVLAAFLLPLMSIVQLPVSYLINIYQNIARNNFILKFIGGCFDCFEKLFLLVNGYGLTKVALDGSNYFSGCSEAMDIVSKNNLRYGALADVVDIALGFVNFEIAGIVTYLFYLYIERNEHHSSGRLEINPVLIVMKKLNIFINNYFLQFIYFSLDYFYRFFYDFSDHHNYPCKLSRGSYFLPFNRRI